MYFHEELEKGVDIFGGTQASTTIKGEDLNKEPIQEIARSVAQTGDDVSAKIQSPGQVSAVWRHLSKQSTSVINTAANMVFQDVIEQMESYYRAIGDEQNG